MTTATAQIAQHLNVVETAIVRVEEWAKVMFVVVKGIGARFVSKKVVKMESVKLQGSEKQVAWAEKIRSFALSEMLRVLEIDKRLLETNKELAQNRDSRMMVVENLNRAINKAEQVIQFCNQQSSATWWIDRRNHTEWQSFERDFDRSSNA